MNKMPLNYNHSGVSISNGNSFVDSIKEITQNDKIGGFSGIYEYNGIQLVAATDGVGTKLKLCEKYTKYDSIISSALKKKSYSLKEAEKINFKTLIILDAIDFLEFFEKNSLSIERLEGAIKYYKNRLK